MSISKYQREEIVRNAALNWLEAGPCPEPVIVQDTVKETRMELAKLAAATDREIVAAALDFAEWAKELRGVLEATSTDRCKAAVG